MAASEVEYEARRRHHDDSCGGSEPSTRFVVSNLGPISLLPEDENDRMRQKIGAREAHSGGAAIPQMA